MEASIYMKAKDVLELLQISRPTLTKYIKQGTIKTITLPNGKYDYDKDSVYKIFNKGVEQKYIFMQKYQHLNKRKI